MVAVVCAGAIFAQNNNDILVKVGNENITKGEFVNAYQKNNNLSAASEQDLREYLNLFINYRMKVPSLVSQESAAITMPKAPQPDSVARFTIQEYLMRTDNQCFHFAKWSPG